MLIILYKTATSYLPKAKFSINKVLINHLDLQNNPMVYTQTYEMISMLIFTSY